MSTKRQLPSTTARGLGYAHRKHRERLLRNHVEGSPCWWCNRPMFAKPEKNHDRKPLSADHTISRAMGGTKADRLLHDVCNKQRGDGTRDYRRPAATGHEIPPEPLDPLLGHRAMPWP